ncbi:DUF2236 domain-containing protein [Rhodococcus hoagii]|nr:DUF2236 domain-containing protein [Prescottella equi]
MHAFVGYHHEHETDWDSGARGLPVNQFDQAGTLGLFSITFLLHTRVLGVRYTRREADAVLHLWCYVGWLMASTALAAVRRTRRAADDVPDRRVLPRSRRTQLRAGRLPLGPAAAHPLPPFQRLRRRYQYERALSLATTLLGRPGAGAAGAGAPALVPAGPARRERPQTSCARPLPGGPAVGAAARRTPAGAGRAAHPRRRDPDVVALPD